MEKRRLEIQSYIRLPVPMKPMAMTVCPFSPGWAMQTALMVSLRSRWRRALSTCETGFWAFSAALATPSFHASTMRRMASPLAASEWLMPLLSELSI